MKKLKNTKGLSTKKRTSVTSQDTVDHVAYKLRCYHTSVYYKILDRFGYGEWVCSSCGEIQPIEEWDLL